MAEKRKIAREARRKQSNFLDEIVDAGKLDRQTIRNTFHAGQDQPQHTEPLEDPSAPPKMAAWRASLLARLGVIIGANGHTVLSYNPRIVQAGVNFILVLCLLPRVVTRALYSQWIASIVIAEVYAHFLSDSGGPNDQSQLEREKSWRGLTTFVLGLHVSMILSKTYYANRGFFGTVFGCTMGFAQMTAAWVRARRGGQRSELAEHSAQEARQLLVRWANAAFRLMVLECRPLSAEQIGEQLVGRQLLTAAEWARIRGRKSRATHVYQWMSNVLVDLLRAGYIHDGNMVVELQKQIDKMRGANVWGLPSLPIMYTLLVNCLVKFYLLQVALGFGAFTAGVDGSDPMKHFGLVFYLFLMNFVFQGLLDLHSVLFSPNKGNDVSHLPADNFLNFVETVTSDLVVDNEDLPYTFSVHDQDSLVNGLDKLSTLWEGASLEHEQPFQTQNIVTEGIGRASASTR